LFGRSLAEGGDVAAGRERRPRPVEHDRAHRFVGAELVEDASELLPRRHRDAVQLPGDVERDRRHAVRDRNTEAVVVRHVVTLSVRSRRRRIFPEGLFGSSPTKRYSRGRFQRASSSSARQNASSSSAAVSGSTTTKATTRWPSLSSAAPTTATSTTFGCRATTSSTSNGWTFSP